MSRSDRNAHPRLDAQRPRKPTISLEKPDTYDHLPANNYTSDGRWQKHSSVMSSTSDRQRDRSYTTPSSSEPAERFGSAADRILKEVCWLICVVILSMDPCVCYHLSLTFSLVCEFFSYFGICSVKNKPEQRKSLKNSQ